MGFRKVEQEKKKEKERNIFIHEQVDGTLTDSQGNLLRLLYSKKVYPIDR